MHSILRISLKVYRFVSNEAMEFIMGDKMPNDTEETVVDQMVREQQMQSKIKFGYFLLFLQQIIVFIENFQKWQFEQSGGGCCGGKADCDDKKDCETEHVHSEACGHHHHHTHDDSCGHDHSHEGHSHQEHKHEGGCCGGDHHHHDQKKLQTIYDETYSNGNWEPSIKIKHTCPQPPSGYQIEHQNGANRHLSNFQSNYLQVLQSKFRSGTPAAAVIMAWVGKLEILCVSIDPKLIPMFIRSDIQSQLALALLTVVIIFIMQDSNFSTALEDTLSLFTLLQSKDSNHQELAPLLSQSLFLLKTLGTQQETRLASLTIANAWLRERNTELSTHVNTLETQLGEVKASAVVLEQEKDTLESTLMGERGRCEGLERQVGELQGQVEELTVMNEQLIGECEGLQVGREWDAQAYAKEVKSLKGEIDKRDKQNGTLNGAMEKLKRFNRRLMEDNQAMKEMIQEATKSPQPYEMPKTMTTEESESELVSNMRTPVNHKLPSNLSSCGVKGLKGLSIVQKQSLRMSMLLHFDKERDRDGGYSDKKGLFHENEEGQLLTEDGDFKDQALQNHLYDDILFEQSSQNSDKSVEEPQDMTQLTVLQPRISSKDTHPLEPFQTWNRPPCKVRSVKKKPKSLREMLQQALVTGDSRDFIKLQRLYKTITMPVNKAQQDL